MSSDFLTTRPIQHLRKSRRCYWCTTQIAPGTAAVHMAGVWEHMFDAFYLHPECHEAWQRDPCHAEDEACTNDHTQGMTCAETDAMTREGD